MKKSLVFLVISLVCNASAQKIIKSELVTDHSVHIIGNDFEGIVFNSDYKGLYPILDTSEYTINTWFTPSIDEIILSEKILRTQVKEFDRKYKYPNGLIVFKQLSKHFRQYIGYKLTDGDKIIYINGFPSDEEWAIQKAKNGKKLLNIPKWYNNLFDVLDGGPQFWHMEINLNSKKIIAFYTNGVA